MQKYDYKTVIFVGPSALGKTYAADSLIKLYPNYFMQAKLYTTRPPRKDDKAVDRIFVDTETFQDMVQSGEFLVHGEFGGNLYGFTESSLIPNEKHILVNAWPALIPQLARLHPKPIIIGLQAPTDWRDMLADRMQARGDNQETINKRFGLIENDIRVTAEHANLIEASGKLFVIDGDKTIPEAVIPWLRQKLGLAEPT